MTPQEIMVLLIAAKAIDDRVIADKERAQAWQYVLDDMTIEEGRDALVAHYKTKSSPLMPADLNEYIRALRKRTAMQQRHPSAERAERIPDAVVAQLDAWRKQRRL